MTLTALTLAALCSGVAVAQDDLTTPSEDPATLAEPVDAPPTGRQYVAVVVGLSSYENLPDPVELDFARSDAATVARSLRELAHFDQVFVMGDGEASRDAIRELLRTEVAQLVGPNDLFLFYFVGHGVGADLDLPTLLAYDSTLENGQEDGLELSAFALDLQTWTQAGTTLIVTDAIHQNQLDGIYFYGPAAPQWPSMRPGTMVLSSSQTAQPAVDGSFGPVFATGIAGAADANRDRYVTASELFAYVLAQLAETGQVPAVSGEYDGQMVLAQDVDPDITPAESGDASADPVYPEYAIDKAKFVWRDGAVQSVDCRDSNVVACAPSCYVWEFTSGPCRLSAVVDGVTLHGEAVVLQRGRYECRRQGDTLQCTGP